MEKIEGAIVRSYRKQKKKKYLATSARVEEKYLQKKMQKIPNKWKRKKADDFNDDII